MRRVGAAGRAPTGDRRPKELGVGALEYTLAFRQILTDVNRVGRTDRQAEPANDARQEPRS
jgi:hypothetical protein